jgi:alpha-mannosidase
MICFWIALMPQAVAAQDTSPAPALYVVGTAHLDTQWRWDIRTTIDEYLPATLHDNFALFEKYPGYVFSFEGAFRYQLIREYYPEEYERLRGYIDQGRWRVAGSWLDAVDVNVPSPESLIRHALYGNGFFKREFGKTSRDVFLPDCFGFGYALPAIATHCGIDMFSTQKLTWGSAVGTPFSIGLWEGVDGSTLLSVLNPGEYVSKIKSDLSRDEEWLATAVGLGETSGLFVASRYFGTGDRGGAPTDESVAWLQRSLESDGPLDVVSAASDQLVRDLTPEQLERLPRYKGELLMTDHGIGCYTSQSAMKRWNRKNELLADAAERAAVAAHWLGGATYPRETLREAWTRFLAHQFHDDLTGTSIPQAYVHSWNDELISLNQFAAVLTDSVAAVSRALDTEVEGIPLVVYNPLAQTREDVVEAEVEFPGGAPENVRVFENLAAGIAEREVPAQVLSSDGATLRVVFVASVPSVGFKVFTVRSAGAPCTLDTGLRAAPGWLENRRYRVIVDDNGDIASVQDKQLGRELLSRPLSLQLLDDEPEEWAAWEIDYDDLMAEPREVVKGPARVRVVENGPARVSLEIERRAGGSVFIQRVRLAAAGSNSSLGDESGNRMEVENLVHWKSPGTLLKAAFPLNMDDRLPPSDTMDSVSPGGTVATYDLGVGVIQRGVNSPKLYEVPAQQWTDLSRVNRRRAAFGVALLSDCRYGWDRPEEAVLRLTLLHTPRVNDRWGWIDDQKSQDLGTHRMNFALVGHQGNWSAGGVASSEAARFNQPLRAFQVPKHPGALGRQFSLLQGDDRGAGVQAVKLAEDDDRLIVRLLDKTGRGTSIALAMPGAPIRSCIEVNGAEVPTAEEATGSATLVAGLLEPYRLRTFAIEPGPPPVTLDPPQCRPLDLPLNSDGVSLDSGRTDGDFDGRGNSISGDLLGDSVVREGITFAMSRDAAGARNVVACKGQKIQLPTGGWNRLYLLAAAVDGGRSAEFRIDDRVEQRWISDWSSPVGQWDSRLHGDRLVHDPDQILPAYINQTPVAWVGTHRHGPDGENQSYSFTNLFRYEFDLVPGARTLTLPNDPAVKVLAATVAVNPNAGVEPAMPLYDRTERSGVMVETAARAFTDSLEVTLSSPNRGAEIRYTLDGREPAADSTLYNGPFVITAETQLRVRAFAPGLDSTFVARADFRKLEPSPALAERTVEPGLESRYYEGDWKELPDFGGIEPERTVVLPTVSIPEYARDVNFGVTLNGYLRIPEEGVYTIGLNSDDGSRLLLDGEEVISNDGLHGSREIRTELALAPGLHSLEIEYFQDGVDAVLELWWSGPGIERHQVPAEALCH